MGDADLREFVAEYGLAASEGQLPPLYRMPNKVEDHPDRVRGLERDLTFLEAIGEAPNIFVIDARGIIRWHSAGLATPPAGDTYSSDYTIQAAIEFALTLR